MGANQNIKVFIAGRPYTISVLKDEEGVVRKAAELLNKTIKDYSNSYEYKDQQDLFAMVALQHVANSIRISAFSFASSSNVWLDHLCWWEERGGQIPHQTKLVQTG